MNSMHSLTMARPRKPLLTLPPHVHRVVSRGRDYFIFKRAEARKYAGPRIKLPHPGDPEFFPPTTPSQRKSPYCRSLVRLMR